MTYVYRMIFILTLILWIFSKGILHGFTAQGMAGKSVQCCDGCDRGLPGCVPGRCETEKRIQAEILALK